MKKHLLAEDPPAVAFARGYAYMAHYGQKYGDEPYEKHLQDVDEVLVRFGFTQSILRVVGQLHDVIEDNFGSQNVIEGKREVERLFGYDVAKLTWAVTDDPRKGNNRRERKADTYKKLNDAGWKAKAVKLADRIANVENTRRQAGGNRRVASLFRMYQKEWLGFRDALYNPKHKQLEAMWQHLAHLLEPIPAKYRR